MKNTVFLTNIPKEVNWGGCENKLMDYFSKIDFSCDKVTLVTTQDVFTEKLKKKSIPVRVVLFPFDFKKIRLKRFFGMYRLFSEVKPNTVVYVQNWFLHFNILDFMAAFIYTKGRVMSLEVAAAPPPPDKKSRMHFKIIPGLNLWWYKQMIPKIFVGRLCKSIIAVSKEVKHRLVDWYYYPESSIFVSYGHMDLNKFSPNSEIRSKMRKKFHIDESDIVIVSTSRLCKGKGMHRVINAFDELYKNKKNLWCFILGDGALRDQLQKLAEKKSSKNRIKFLGFKNSVDSFLQMSDIFILASDSEGMAASPMEAMATGLVVVSTKVSGANEIIINGANGFLVEFSEKGVLEGLLRAISLTPKQRAIMAANARKCIQEEFKGGQDDLVALTRLGLKPRTQFDAIVR